MEKVRPPAVAGQFYPGDPEKLRQKLAQCYRHPLGPGGLPEVSPQALDQAEGPAFIGTAGYIVPHAGYDYSGPVAAHAFGCMARLGRPRVVALLGPNHHGLGHALALSPWEQWRTPLGTLPVETTLACRLAELMPGLVPDAAAHRHEHSLEVLLPFLVHLYGPSIAILPIVMADQSLAVAQLLGEALASIVGEGGILVLASSDFSHYLADPSARREDSYALQAIQALDAAALARVVRERGLNMCGPGPVMALLVAFRAMGAASARLLAYATSGDTSGDRTSVVGYAAVEVHAR